MKKQTPSGYAPRLFDPWTGDELARKARARRFSYEASEGEQLVLAMLDAGGGRGDAGQMFKHAVGLGISSDAFDLALRRLEQRQVVRWEGQTIYRAA